MNLNTDMAVNRITDDIWEIPLSEKPGMLVPARIYANEGLAQVIFLRATDLCEVSYADRKGKYQAQNGITLPRQ